MVTVTNTFERFFSRATNTSTTSVTGTISAGTDMVITGLIVANTHATLAIGVNVYINNGAADYYLIKGNSVPVSESLIAIGWDQKVVLKAGDTLMVTTTTAGHTGDVSVSALKIVTS